jgi:hypothetical protein
MSDQTDSYRPRCKNLHCKSMMVYGEAFESDPDYQMGLMDFVCLSTSKGQGPDGNGVSLEECSSAERGCFKEF